MAAIESTDESTPGHTQSGTAPTLADLAVPMAAAGVAEAAALSQTARKRPSRKTVAAQPREPRAARKTAPTPKKAATQKPVQTAPESVAAPVTPLPPPSTARLGRTHSNQSFRSATSGESVELAKGKGRAPVAGVTLLTPNKGTALANVNIVDSNVVAVLHGMERQQERHDEDMAGLHLTLARLVEQVDTVEERLCSFVGPAVENAVRHHVPLALDLPELRTDLRRLETRVEGLSVAHNHLISRVQGHWESLDSQVQDLTRLVSDRDAPTERNLSPAVLTPPVTPARRGRSPSPPPPPSANATSSRRRARLPSLPVPPSARRMPSLGRRTNKKPRLEGDARVAARDYSNWVHDIATGTQHVVPPTQSAAKMDVLVGPVSWALPDIVDDVMTLLAPACAHVPDFAGTVLGVSLDDNGKWVRMAVTSHFLAKSLEQAWRRHRPPQYGSVKIVVVAPGTASK